LVRSSYHAADFRPELDLEAEDFPAHQPIPSLEHGPDSIPLLSASR
jgi:hypothetical protein